MNFKSSISFILLAWATTVNASDRECSDEGYDDICNCNLYKSTNCEKPKYYYNNGEGGSYNIKNWDEDCAACCCITVRDTEQSPPPTRSPPTPVPPTPVPPTPTATRPPTMSPTQWSSQWSNNDSWSGGGSGGGSTKPKPKPKKPVQKPTPKKVAEVPKPKPKAMPKPKPSSGGGGSSWSSGNSWNGSGGWGSGTPTLTPVTSPISVREPSIPSLAPIPTRSTPESSQPFPVRRPSPVAVPVPTKPSYYYNAEGSSYKQKSASGALAATSQISSAVWAGIAVVAVGVIAFVVGLYTGRTNNHASADEMIEDTRYERS